MPPTILPGIAAVIHSFIEQLHSGQLIQDIGISLLRVLEGYAIAVVLGISFGIFMAVSAATNRFFAFIFDAIRQIPTMAFIPLLIIWLGIGETTKIIMIVKSAFFPVLLNTMSGIKETPQGYVELAKLYKLNKIDILTKIYLPSATPAIFVGLKVALGISWTTVVGAELIAATSGIGYRINDARMLMEPEVVIVGMFVIGIVGIIMDRGLSYIGKKVTPWANNR